MSTTSCDNLALSSSNITFYLYSLQTQKNTLIRMQGAAGYGRHRMLSASLLLLHHAPCHTPKHRTHRIPASRRTMNTPGSLTHNSTPYCPTTSTIFRRTVSPVGTRLLGLARAQFKFRAIHYPATAHPPNPSTLLHSRNLRNQINTSHKLFYNNNNNNNHDDRRRRRRRLRRLFGSPPSSPSSQQQRRRRRTTTTANDDDDERRRRRTTANDDGGGANSVERVETLRRSVSRHLASFGSSMLSHLRKYHCQLNSAVVQCFYKWE